MSLKEKLYKYCVNYVTTRIEGAKGAILDAQKSANEETKSSAGDKYETGRAMAQLEIEKNSAQLAEAMKLKQALEQISPEQSSSAVQVGSLVTTDQGKFYIAISVGQVEMESVLYFVVSPTSPIARQMLGLKLNTSFSFQGKNFLIQKIS
jgi:transcription elongation GreA/GreB family factor